MVVSSFGSFVTHGERRRDPFEAAVRADPCAETKNFIYFYLGVTAFLLWKTT